MAEDKFFDELWKGWQELWHLRVSKMKDEEKFMRAIFHSFLGIVNPVCYIYATKYSSTRIHPFIFMRTGFNKGEIMKMERDLLEYISNEFYNPRYIGKVTDAGITSKDVYVGKNVVLKKGLLYESRAIFFDEGRNLFLRSEHYESLITTLNMAMDEDGMGGGRVCRVLRGGEVDYITRSTIIVGSIPLEVICDSLGDGFLERFFILYKPITDDELIGAKASSIFLTKVNKFDTNKVMSCIKLTIQAFLNKAYEIYVKKFADAKLSALPFIEFDNTLEVEKMSNEFKEYCSSEVKRAFAKDPIKQSQLMDFVSRLIEKAMKIAVHKAVFDLKNVVSLEDFKYGLDVCKIHLESVINLLMKQTTGLNQKKIDGENNLEKILIGVVKNNQFGKVELRDCLCKMHGWIFSEVPTLRFINRKVEEGLLKEEPTKIPTATGGTRKLIIKLKE